MNIDDMASADEEFSRDMALKMKMRELPKTGFCFNCREPVKPNANYCDVDCRRTHERRVYQQKAKVL